MQTKVRFSKFIARHRDIFPLHLGRTKVLSSVFKEQEAESSHQFYERRGSDFQNGIVAVRSLPLKNQRHDSQTTGEEGGDIGVGEGWWHCSKLVPLCCGSMQPVAVHFGAVEFLSICVESPKWKSGEPLALDDWDEKLSEDLGQGPLAEYGLSQCHQFCEGTS